MTDTNVKSAPDNDVKSVTDNDVKSVTDNDARQYVRGIGVCHTFQGVVTPFKVSVTLFSCQSHSVTLHNPNASIKALALCKDSRYS